MNITFFETESWEETYLREKLDEHKLQFFSEPLSMDRIPDLLKSDIISPFIYSSLTPAIMTRLPFLKLITTRSTGTDHIDTQYCSDHGIQIGNVPTYGEHTVAEHTIALLLALVRKFPQSIDRTRRGDFSSVGLEGSELFGKTIGIIGDGTIGRAVMSICTGFGMHVLVYSRHPDEKKAKKMGIRYVELSELYSTSDIITIHIPYTDETHHFIGKDALRQMKHGVYLINTARGGIIDTEALVRSLGDEKVAGAGLDVLEGERNLKEERQLLSKNFINTIDVKTQLLNHVLLTHPNVIVTPHTAFDSREALVTILAVTVENIVSYVHTGKAKNTVK
jgi:D-lactate dehydrogenase